MQNKLDISEKALIIDLIIEASQKTESVFIKNEYLKLIKKINELTN